MTGIVEAVLPFDFNSLTDLKKGLNF